MRHCQLVKKDSASWSWLIMCLSKYDICMSFKPVKSCGF